jgi:hypothetical protein
LLNKLKSGGTAVLGVLIIVALLALVGLVIEGAGWVTAKVFPWVQFFAVLALAVMVLVLLPLSAFKKTRPFAAMCILYISFLLGLRLWMDGLLATLTFWGVGGVIVGLLFAGVGVVPVGMLAALFHGQWAQLIDLIAFTFFTFGARFFAIWLGSKIDRDAQIEADKKSFMEITGTLDP